ncbi:chlorite dismutase family protein [Herbaspirillum rhizosphaerae]|uniref:chlorite dismutase family protein n=1 Tax=Herbaspirillum rhizosphaerae TaxID=346179 RepID=UPI00067BEF4E|nr:chlorite dismutase family protein [Herbaspirillum rhizosphaerae]
MNERLWSFSGGDHGQWRVTDVIAVTGEALAVTAQIDIVNGAPSRPAVWTLQGVTSNERYVQQDEKQKLVAVQQGLGRAASTQAALIPIRKSAAWWALTQDERRDILEIRSRHIEIGLRYLPPIARRLHHCRDLATVQAYDFLTWFEFAPEHAGAFDDLLAALRNTPEWTYVERETEVRLQRNEGP